jgi:hypothetical protein
MLKSEMKKLRFLKISFYASLLLLFGGQVNAQISNPAMPDTSTGERLADLRIGAYLDLYSGWFSKAGKDGSVLYFVSMNQTRSVSVNLAMLDFRYSKNRIRARFMPGFGSYMNSNYSAEPGGLGYLVEANAGYCLFPNRQIWLDAGVLSSPYSNESCISRDHLMYSRSLAPEYVPYYLSGIKLTLPLSKSLNLYLYALNGWQQIQDKNEYPAFGSQLEWRGQKSLINWNTFIGDERRSLPGVKGMQQRMRWFTDLYWVYNPEGKLSATACAYAGVQEYAAGWKFRQAAWWQANAILRYRISERNSISARLEYFSDPRAAVTEPLFGNIGFETGSGGLCWNVNLSENALFRLEGRHFFSGLRLFETGKQGQQATWLLSGMTIWF